jgi:uncharacterized protein (DUF488 family)
MSMTVLFTIGFSGKKEDDFYSIFDAVEVKKLFDIRLWRVSRFLPWASGTNLAKRLGKRYIYMQECAPTKELLFGYKDGSISWNEYEKIFGNIMRERQIEQLFTLELLDGSCLLCSEKTPEMCHRRLVAEYLVKKFHNIIVRHL